MCRFSKSVAKLNSTWGWKSVKVTLVHFNFTLKLWQQVNLALLWIFFYLVFYFFFYYFLLFTIHVLVQILFCIWFSGRGYDVMLNNILMAEIMPIVEEFDEQTNNGKRINSYKYIQQSDNCLFKTRQLIRL